ncbi:MAG: HAMP domain-containing histidine kinase [Clostridia bacterium]|nr:HAMP domain-containing histidine kinase [Clostridia bacterium]
MFFVVWAAFALLSLLLLAVFSVTHRVVLKNTYEKEAVRSLGEKGKRINHSLREVPPDVFQNNYDGFIRYLSSREGILICILDEQGKVLMPLEENVDPSAPVFGENFDFSTEIVKLKAELSRAGATEENQKSVLYAVAGGYVYGSVLPAYDASGRSTYLYTFESVEFVRAVEDTMNVRMLWTAVFVFILSFAVSSAISGALIRPLDEISVKAKRLAKGDFDVDFSGEDYFEEMEALSASLNFAKDELSKTDRMQKELIANVSHDFKTPLTMIKAYAEMIIEVAGDDKAKREKSARVIMEEADRLASLVSDVLDLSKIRSGIQALEMQTFDLSAYLEETLARFGYLTETQGYRLDAKIEQELYTRADQMKIGQVLYNLIGNAVNYTGDDKRVKVLLQREENCIRFAVSDTGAGIAEDELAGIWDRYYRSSEAHKRPVQGTGLGLSIVKTILERHQFVFGVDSVLGQGSTFYVLFPIGEIEQKE